MAAIKWCVGCGDYETITYMAKFCQKFKTSAALQESLHYHTIPINSTNFPSFCISVRKNCWKMFAGSCPRKFPLCGCWNIFKSTISWNLSASS